MSIPGALGTPVCEDITVARDQLVRIRTNLLELGQRNGFRVAASGTHPFSRWEGREETIAQYRQFAEDTQMRMRRYLITMAVRTVCFILAVVVDSWVRWVFAVGGGVLPYIARVLGLSP